MIPRLTRLCKWQRKTESCNGRNPIQNTTMAGPRLSWTKKEYSISSVVPRGSVRIEWPEASCGRQLSKLQAVRIANLTTPKSPFGERRGALGWCDHPQRCLAGGSPLCIKFVICLCMKKLCLWIDMRDDALLR